MPAFRCDALVVVFLDFVVHVEIFCRGLFREFRRNVQGRGPGVESSEFGDILFFVPRGETVFRLETQVFGHPYLLTDLDGTVSFPVASVSEGPVLECFGVLGEAIFVRGVVLRFGGFALCCLADLDANAECRGDDDGEGD